MLILPRKGLENTQSKVFMCVMEWLCYISAIKIWNLDCYLEPFTPFSSFDIKPILSSVFIEKRNSVHLDLVCLKYTEQKK